MHLALCKPIIRPTLAHSAVVHLCSTRQSDSQRRIVTACKRLLRICFETHARVPVASPYFFSRRSATDCRPATIGGDDCGLCRGSLYIALQVAVLRRQRCSGKEPPLCARASKTTRLSLASLLFPHLEDVKASRPGAPRHNFLQGAHVQHPGESKAQNCDERTALRPIPQRALKADVLLAASTDKR